MGPKSSLLWDARLAGMQALIRGVRQTSMAFLEYAGPGAQVAGVAVLHAMPCRGRQEGSASAPVVDAQTQAHALPQLRAQPVAHLRHGKVLAVVLAAAGTLMVCMLQAAGATWAGLQHIPPRSASRPPPLPPPLQRLAFVQQPAHHVRHPGPLPGEEEDRRAHFTLHTTLGM